MKYAVRWLDRDGTGREEDAGTDHKGAVELAQTLACYYDGVEVLDETGRVVWPFNPADADLRG